MYSLYFFITIFTTTIGAITGVGGGVILKPVLDMLGHYDTLTISVLSSVTVLSMATISIVKQLLNKSKFEAKIVLPLSVGSIFGGYIGQNILRFIIDSVQLKNNVIILQNVGLALVIAIIFLYTLNKDKIASKNISGILPSIIVGMFLGMLSSFFAIGGGPVNVAVFMYLFSYDIKMSVLASIVTIFFTQISNIFSILLTNGFDILNISILPFMVIGAIIGSFIGSKLSIQFTGKQINLTFKCVQILVLIICIINIILQIQ